MPAEELNLLAWIVLAVAFGCAGVIVLDMSLGGRRQAMWIMAIVWPVTALYLGPLALAGYWRWGRGRHQQRSLPVASALAVSHCGAGCTLGDIVGSSLVLVLGLQVAGLGLWAELPLDFALAYLLGIAFQYLTIAPMRGLGLRDGIVAALKADTLSLLAFEVGLFSWMILVQLVFFAGHLHADEPAFWLMMQIGMALGFVTAYPVNWWLVRTGVKESM